MSPKQILPNIMRIFVYLKSNLIFYSWELAMHSKRKTAKLKDAIDYQTADNTDSELQEKYADIFKRVFVFGYKYDKSNACTCRKSRNECWKG